MKKILAIVVVSLLLMPVQFMTAAEQGQVEEYDEETYGPEEPIVWNKPVEGVIFSHKVHTLDNGLDCDSCHDDLFAMEAGAAEEQENFTMEAMYDGEYCGACHDGETAFAADTRCTACHIGVRGVRRLTGEAGAQEKTSH